jgi:hypothetical protein
MIKATPTAKPHFNWLTPTAVELYSSPRFWLSRVEQQAEYIARYKGSRMEVKLNAIDVLEMCQYNAITAAPTAFEKGIVSAAIENIGGAQQPPRTNRKEVLK